MKKTRSTCDIATPPAEGLAFVLGGNNHSTYQEFRTKVLCEYQELTKNPSFANKTALALWGEALITTPKHLFTSETQ